MILAGVDEAGYGPVLGPLVVSVCAVEIPDADATDHIPSDDIPNVWKLLPGILSQKKCAKGRRLHVNDSKAVYSPSAGMKELERAVLCMAINAGTPCGSLQELLLGASDVAAHLGQYAWYHDGLDTQFPLEIDAMAVKISSNALSVACRAAKCQFVHYRSRVLLERQFNDAVSKTQNKASASFSLVASHFDDLMKRFGDKNLTIVCDRQGGREHYGNLLRMMFEEWSLEIESESPKRAEYRLKRGNQSVRIIFAEKAESLALPVAAASMLAKYTREALMHRFNCYWKKHNPELKPTAGYYTDGMRFLTDIAELRKMLGVKDEQLIRCR